MHNREAEHFLSDLANQRELAPQSQALALNALVFLSLSFASQLLQSPSIATPIYCNEAPTLEPFKRNWGVAISDPPKSILIY
ncbi:phage integrase N-terminal SAM-like domain-containing protein [Agarivorans sp. QJM3NY_33]|uniref:phage integrase N-terminal SAM-like domain-containing protein n=1 Tax=Agarivorans sp. QJM3NY_33 TaxID=3421432 RepID=UPI003D7E0386